jgi:hypothetical protein
VPSSAQGYRYARFLFDDGRNPRPLGLATIMVGTFVEITLRPASIDTRFPSAGAVVVPRESGLDYPTSGKVIREHTMTWDDSCALIDSDLEAIQQLAAQAGPNLRVVVDMRAPKWEAASAGTEGNYPADPGQVLVGYLSAARLVRYNYRRYGATITVREVG